MPRKAKRARSSPTRKAGKSLSSMDSMDMVKGILPYLVTLLGIAGVKKGKDYIAHGQNWATFARKYLLPGDAKILQLKKPKVIKEMNNGPFDPTVLMSMISDVKSKFELGEEAKRLMRRYPGLHTVWKVLMEKPRVLPDLVTTRIFDDELTRVNALPTKRKEDPTYHYYDPEPLWIHLNKLFPATLVNLIIKEYNRGMAIDVERESEISEEGTTPPTSTTAPTVKEEHPGRVDLAGPFDPVNEEKSYLGDPIRFPMDQTAKRRKRPWRNLRRYAADNDLNFGDTHSEFAGIGRPIPDPDFEAWASVSSMSAYPHPRGGERYRNRKRSMPYYFNPGRLRENY